MGPPRERAKPSSGPEPKHESQVKPETGPEQQPQPQPQT
jgi:hypothetical protein